LHVRGLKDAHIAEQMGIKRAYFSQIVNGLAVSDQVVDRMCSAFGFKKIAPNKLRSIKRRRAW
jgi:plasmid maintenance system antidote protein VapI